MPDLIQTLERRVAATPDKLAFSFVGANGDEQARLDYAAFHARVNAIALGLAARPGLAPRDRVLMCFQPGLDMVTALFGCIRAGLIAVPVPPLAAHDFAAGLNRIAHVARDSGATAILSDPATRSLFDRPPALPAPAQAQAARVGALDWIDIRAMPDSAPAGPDRKPGDIALLQYTSGSTSDPKGVVVTQNCLLANRPLVVDHDDAVCVTWLPQHHDMGLIGCYVNSALSGATTYGMATATFIRRPALWLRLLSRHRATAASAPNFAYEFCLDPRRVPDHVVDELDLGAMRALTIGAEPVRPETFRRFRARFARAGLGGAALMAGYGLAENTLVVSNRGHRALSVDKDALARGRARPVQDAYQIGNARRLMSCGRPLGDNVVRIVDPETCRGLEDGRVGEIWVTGSSKCAGYWQQAETSRAVFQARLTGDGTGADFLRTGDQGFLLKGELFVCGRMKERIIQHGRNFYPQDIEAAVEAGFPALRPGAVAAVTLGDFDAPAQVALVAGIGRAQTPPDGAEVMRLVQEQVGLVLDRVLFVRPRVIPKTTSGKIRRFALCEALSQNRLDPVASYHRPGGAGRVAPPPDRLSLADELRQRYDLTENARLTLAETGVDSLDLVTLLHSVQEAAVGSGLERLTGDIDIRLIQQMRGGDLLRLLDMVEAAHPADLPRLHALLSAITRENAAAEQARMRSDLSLVADLRAPATAEQSRPGAVLLTGATGFLGPHLLANLLERGNRPVQVLVRAENATAGMDRLLREAAAGGVTLCPDRLRDRVEVLCGDLSAPLLGLGPDGWDRLARTADTICHNGAEVNYLKTYDEMRGANVVGTAEILRLAATGRPKQVNYVSTTFIFGWTAADLLLESDRNDGMERLDFGYSQSKWVAEQLLHRAMAQGVAARIFRPALITPSVTGQGSLDITLRLLAFVFKHGIGPGAGNQLSLLPVDVTARNIVALCADPATIGGTFHVTSDAFSDMSDVIGAMARRTGRQFDLYPIRDFVDQVVARCTRDDPLYPLVDFLIRAVDNLVAMEHKRYDSRAYRAARDANPGAVPHPGLTETVDGILSFLAQRNLC